MYESASKCLSPQSSDSHVIGMAVHILTSCDQENTEKKGHMTSYNFFFRSYIGIQCFVVV